jgi:AraC-like DNA-binding protein
MMNAAATSVPMEGAAGPRLSGLEAAHYPAVTSGCTSVPEAYTCFTMVDSVQGDVELISRGVRARCEPGWLTVGQPGEAWVLRARSDMRAGIRIVRLYNDLYDAVRDEIGVRGSRSPFRRGPLRVPGLDQRFTRLHDAVDRGEPLEAQELLLRFLATLAPRQRQTSVATPTRNGSTVRRAEEYLQARFVHSVSLDELARVARTDKFALLRAFSRELGTTPHAYQMRLRMTRARELIAQGLPLAEIAVAVGYSEQSALTRAFKSVVGITPGAYARAVR